MSAFMDQRSYNTIQCVRVCVRVHLPVYLAARQLPVYASITHNASLWQLQGFLAMHPEATVTSTPQATFWWKSTDFQRTEATLLI